MELLPAQDNMTIVVIFKGISSACGCLVCDCSIVIVIEMSEQEEHKALCGLRR